jgi:hypothetical protein
VNDLTAFEQLMRASRVRLMSAFEALWLESEEMLREACPDGFDVLQIGRTAWDCLPDEASREEALDVLFYAFWEALEDRKTRTTQGGAA